MSRTLTLLAQSQDYFAQQLKSSHPSERELQRLSMPFAPSVALSHSMQSAEAIESSSTREGGASSRQASTVSGQDFATSLQDHLPDSILGFLHDPQQHLHAFFALDCGMSRLLDKNSVLSTPSGMLNTLYGTTLVHMLTFFGGLKSHYERTISLPFPENTPCRTVLQQADEALEVLVEVSLQHLRQQQSLLKEDASSEDALRGLVSAALVLCENVVVRLPSQARMLIEWIARLALQRADQSANLGSGLCIRVGDNTVWWSGNHWTPLFWRAAILDRNIHLQDGELIILQIDWSGAAGSLETWGLAPSDENDTVKDFKNVRTIDDCLTLLCRLDDSQYLSPYTAQLQLMEKEMATSITGVGSIEDVLASMEPLSVAGSHPGQQVRQLDSSFLYRALLIELYIPLIPAAAQLRQQTMENLEPNLFWMIQKTERVIEENLCEIMRLAQGCIDAAIWLSRGSFAMAALQVAKHAMEKMKSNDSTLDSAARSWKEEKLDELLQLFAGPWTSWANSVAKSRQARRRRNTALSLPSLAVSPVASLTNEITNIGGALEAGEPFRKRRASKGLSMDKNDTSFAEQGFSPICASPAAGSILQKGESRMKRKQLHVDPALHCGNYVNPFVMDSAMESERRATGCWDMRTGEGNYHRQMATGASPALARDKEKCWWKNDSSHDFGSFPLTPSRLISSRGGLPAASVAAFNPMCGDLDVSGERYPPPLCASSSTEDLWAYFGQVFGERK